jgi:hypothetical protein
MIKIEDAPEMFRYGGDGERVIDRRAGIMWIWDEDETRLMAFSLHYEPKPIEDISGPEGARLWAALLSWSYAVG